MPNAVPPSELATLLSESPRLQASFLQLDPSHRDALLAFVVAPVESSVRSRRAALAALSLFALARDLPLDSPCALLAAQDLARTSARVRRVG